MDYSPLDYITFINIVAHYIFLTDKLNQFKSQKEASRLLYCSWESPRRNEQNILCTGTFKLPLWLSLHTSQKQIYLCIFYQYGNRNIFYKPTIIQGTEHQKDACCFAVYTQHFSHAQTIEIFTFLALLKQ